MRAERCIPSCHVQVRTTTELELKGDYTLEIAEASIHREEVVTKGQDVTLTVPLVKGALQRPQAQWFFQGQAIKESEKVSLPNALLSTAVLTFQEAIVP